MGSISARTLKNGTIRYYAKFKGLDGVDHTFATYQNSMEDALKFVRHIEATIAAHQIKMPGHVCIDSICNEKRECKGCGIYFNVISSSPKQYCTIGCNSHFYNVNKRHGNINLAKTSASIFGFKKLISMSAIERKRNRRRRHEWKIINGKR